MLLVGNQKGYILWMLGYYMELFLPQLRYDAGKICVNLANSPLVVEQNNYSTKIVIVYDLNDWPKVLLRNLTLKKMFVWSN